MDAISLSTSLAAGAVDQQAGVSVLRALEGLDKTVAAELFASIGLGGAIDARA